MTTLTCEHCGSEIDVAADPRCVVYDPSGATDVICAACRERAYDRWQESLAAGEGPQSACEALREAYAIKRGWRSGQAIPITRREHRAYLAYLRAAGSSGGGHEPIQDGRCGMRCDRCKFWKAKEHKSEGDCHRNAPSPYYTIDARIVDYLSHIAWAQYEALKLDPTQVDSLPSLKEGAAFWPSTDGDEWCGEFQPR